MITLKLGYTPHVVRQLDEINEWIVALPYTKRGHYAYRVRNHMRKFEGKRLPNITFVRREDAMAFKLRFNV